MSLALASRHRIAAVNMSLGGDLYRRVLRLRGDEAAYRPAAGARRCNRCCLAQSRRGGRDRVPCVYILGDRRSVPPTMTSRGREINRVFEHCAPWSTFSLPGSFINSSVPGGFFADLLRAPPWRRRTSPAPGRALKTKFPIGQRRPDRVGARRRPASDLPTRRPASPYRGSGSMWRFAHCFRSRCGGPSFSLIAILQRDGEAIALSYGCRRYRPESGR